jgi:hypothetical protein
MTEFSKKPKQKLEKSFKEVLDENSDKVEFIDNTNSEIKNQLNQMKDQYLDYLKKTCDTQFKWLDQHAAIIANENGIHVHINENPDGISADAVLSSLHSCASMNDHGISEFFTQKNAVKKEIVTQTEICMNVCSAHADEKDEYKLKNCINNCFIQSFDQTKKLLDEIQEKINLVKDKFFV